MKIRNGSLENLEKLNSKYSEFLLEEIDVMSLFGMYNYSNIHFKSDEGILIIHGENGLGKTTLLNLINSFKKGNFNKILEVNFTNFMLKFLPLNHISKSSKDINFILVQIKKEEISKLDITIFEISNNEPRIVIKFPFGKRSSSNSKLDDLFQQINFIRNELAHEVLDSERYHALNQEYQYLIRNASRYELHEKKKSQVKFPEPLSSFLNKFRCHLISSERLDISHYIESRYKPRTKKREKFSSVIGDKRGLLINKITRNFREYLKISQSQDSDLVERIITVIEKTEEFHYDDSEFQKEIEVKLKNFVNKQENYRNAGFDISESVKIDLLSSFQRASKWEEKWKKPILFDLLVDVILADGEEKLAVFDSLYEKIALFKKIINSHLSKNKRLETHNRKGILIRNLNNKKEIAIESLSSGEKHLIVLFFEFIFETAPNTLILIDEPEISLHIDWQIKFIKNLIKLKKSNIEDLKNIRFILSTHSPQIVHDRWDLTRELTLED